jgi:quinoprotein glucose dehydrogenase
VYRNLLIAVFCGTLAAAAADPIELTGRFKQLPTVAEADLPAMKNTREEFPGIVQHEGLAAHTWVRFPFLENPGSFGFDRKGRVFVAEVNRLWLGVPDLRGAHELIREDFQAVTVADRGKLYEKYAHHFPAGWFTAVADRIIRLEDRDGNGAADHRSLFSDHFNNALDGVGFSVLAEDDAVYFTCIPNVWKMTDADDDGVADTHEKIAEGFGSRVSFIGHDLHGLVRGPDGMLYFSIGDRSYHVTTKEGEVISGPGKGAIFRCDSDGSNFERFCDGLRNPQELAFDENGNLFTFDNTGDIGDVARMVYALEGSDSGWNMAHQSAHHYRNVLDWGDFHPPASMWVAEDMFETYTEAQPQWVYPPASHVARGPSGVTWLTGDSLPADLQGKFLLANYRGPSPNCTILTIGVEPKGAGYVANHEEVLVKGIGASDVELGYDGNIYLCDFGGGWSVNTNGAIHVLSGKGNFRELAGFEAKSLFREGPKAMSTTDLGALLKKKDFRLRQMAQFELVARGEVSSLIAATTDRNATRTRLHGVWGLGQLARQGKSAQPLIDLLADADPEVRANAARVLGHARVAAARDPLIARLADDSPRVKSLAAIALGRVAKPGDRRAVQGLFRMAAKNGAAEPVDPVLRHACLTALATLATDEQALVQHRHLSREVRLCALLVLRRHESQQATEFLADSDPLIRREAIRAIYDTSACDGPAGDALALAEFANLPDTVQRRIMAANYRRGTDENARTLVKMAGSEALADSVREAALIGLRLWEKGVETDPVLGHYRPQAVTGRTMKSLGPAIATELKAFLTAGPPPKLSALALKLADETDVKLEQDILRAQVGNPALPAELRVASLDSLVGVLGPRAKMLVQELLADPDGEVQAAAMRHGFALALPGIADSAKQAIESGALPVARAGIVGLGVPKILQLWYKRKENGLRKELWLDLYLELIGSDHPGAKKALGYFANAGKHAVHQLSAHGGDSLRGRAVFENQGACLQCHRVGGKGGVQGPPLHFVGERQTPQELVESLVDPGAVVREDYGSSTITLKDGTVIVGRVASPKDAELVSIVAMNGAKTEVPPEQVESVSKPISAMPPVALALPPRDLRDLVAFLSTRTNINLMREQGWTPMFDGKTLDSWSGDSRFWRAEAGWIIGESSEAKQPATNTFLLYTGDNTDGKPVEFGDFELRLVYLIPHGNSGVQYRSFQLPSTDNTGAPLPAWGKPEISSPWRVGGYQAEIIAGGQTDGKNYGENFRQHLAERGERATITGTRDQETARGPVPDAVRTIDVFAESAELQHSIKTKPGAWNTLTIRAEGNKLSHIVNDTLVSEVIDEDARFRRDKGLIALQLHWREPTRVQFRNLRIRPIEPEQEH